MGPDRQTILDFAASKPTAHVLPWKMGHDCACFTKGNWWPVYRLPIPQASFSGVLGTRGSPEVSLLTRKTEELGLEPMPVGDLGQTDSLALLSVGPSWTDGGW